MKDESLEDMPASELVTLMDYCVWEVNHNGRATVQAWRDELSARAEATDSEVVRAVAICRISGTRGLSGGTGSKSDSVDR